jgi:5-oxoprolinase (ATP-hydrolysing) subunit A
MNRIDLNADLGESFGAWRLGDDAAVMPWITSANIACGFHAGDPGTIHRTIALAVEHGVVIGAHPSLPDLQGFGRRDMRITPDDAYTLTLYQIGALHAFARAAGARLRHVKPHGALYNMAARDRTLAGAIARAVGDFDRDLILVGLAASALVDAGREIGLEVASEGFCDRRYRPDGSLVPRAEPGAVIESVDEAIAQALSIALQGRVVAAGGGTVEVRADSLCVHGDRADAGEFARRLREALRHAGVSVAAPGIPA